MNTRLEIPGGKSAALNATLLKPGTQKQNIKSANPLRIEEDLLLCSVYRRATVPGALSLQLRPPQRHDPAVPQAYPGLCVLILWTSPLPHP